MSYDGAPCPRCATDNTVETWDGSGAYPPGVLCASCGHHWNPEASWFLAYLRRLPSSLRWLLRATRGRA